MAALVAVCGSVWDDSVPFPNIPAFKNLKKIKKSYIRNSSLK